MGMLDAIMDCAANNAIALQTLRDLIVAVAAVFTACLAYWGLSTWKQEFVGKRKIDLAEDVLTSFYEAKDIIEGIRSPLAGGGEGSTRQAGANETPEEKAAYDLAYVTLERYYSRIEFFSKFRSARYRFMTRFGKDKAAPFDDLLDAVRRVKVSASSLARLYLYMQHAHGNREREEDLQKKIEKHDAIIYFGGDDDEIACQVEKAVEDIEKLCRAIIDHKL